MRMKNELRAVAGAAVVALLVAGCGSNPVPSPVVAHGVAVREPLVDPRPYGTADAAFGLDVLGAVCRSDPRANLVLQLTGDADERTWVGRRLQVGEAVLEVVRTPKHCLGVYAEVRTPGRVAEGYAVVLSDELG